MSHNHFQGHNCDFENALLILFTVVVMNIQDLRQIQIPAISLISFHFLSTFILLFILKLIGVFKVKRVKILKGTCLDLNQTGPD